MSCTYNDGMHSITILVKYSLYKSAPIMRERKKERKNQSGVLRNEVLSPAPYRENIDHVNELACWYFV